MNQWAYQLRALRLESEHESQHRSALRLHTALRKCQYKAFGNRNPSMKISHPYDFGPDCQASSLPFKLKNGRG